MSELLITKELIAQVLASSGKTMNAFSKDIGVSTKALRAYLDGRYAPRNALVIARIKKWAGTYSSSAPVNDETPPASAVDTLGVFPTAENIKQMREASGLTIEQFAAQFGLRKSTFSNYEYGQIPTDQKIKDAISVEWQAYADKHGMTAQVPLATVDEFAPEVLKAFQKHLGLSVKQVAALVGVSADIWYKWIKGEHYPNHVKNVKALRKVLGNEKVKGKPGRKSNLTDAAASKGGKHQLSVATAHEIANEFHARYQPRVDELIMDGALTTVCEQYKIDRRRLRSAVAALLLILKDRMTPQDIYAWFSGHSV